MFQKRILHDLLQPFLVFLLIAGSSFAQSGNGRVPDLIRAIRDGERKKAEDLIEHNKDINAQDDYGWSPLMYAALKSDSELIEKLLAHDADINLPDRDGVTPLIAAIINMPRPFMVQYLPDDQKRAKDVPLFLISKGADPNRADNEGNAPLIYAVIDSQEQIIGALISKGADLNRTDRYGCTPLFYMNHPDIAKKWAPASGALTINYRMRGISADESRFPPDYAAKVAAARAEANVPFEQTKARIAELLKRSGGLAPDSPNAQAVGEHLIDARPQRLGLGRTEPIGLILKDYYSRTRETARIDMLVRVTPDGTVNEALIVSGLPNGLSEEIKKLTPKLRYQPAMKNGQPVEAWDRIVTFVISR